MAILFIGKSKCALCGDVLAKGELVIATQHFISDSKDPLWRFSDAGMHYDCFQDWEHRDAFVEKYNKSWFAKATLERQTYHHMNEDGTIDMLPAEREDIP